MCTVWWFLPHFLGIFSFLSICILFPFVACAFDFILTAKQLKEKRQKLFMNKPELWDPSYLLNLIMQCLHVNVRKTFKKISEIFHSQKRAMKARSNQDCNLFFAFSHHRCAVRLHSPFFPHKWCEKIERMECGPKRASAKDF